MADNQAASRAKDNLPTVLLTMLSIMQALALELMWEHLTDQTYLYAWTMVAVIGWAQIGTTLLGVLLIWLIYTGLVTRFSWVPTTTDSVFPFIVGIVEFSQINALGPSHIGPWFLILSVLFGIMIWVSQVTMRRARQDPDNHEFFSTLKPASRTDMAISFIPVAILTAFGAAIWHTQDQGWLTLAGLLCAAGMLCFQLRMSHVFTQRSYGRGHGVTL